MKRLHDDILSLIIAYHTGNCCDAEKQRLEAWVKADAENQRQFRRCLALLHDINLSQKAMASGKVKRLLREPVRRQRLRRAGYAAAVLVAVGAGFFLLDRKSNAPAGNEVIAKLVNDVTLTLPDGSQIVLDRSTENSLVAQQDDIALVRKGDSLVHQKHGGHASATAETKWGVLKVPRGARFGMVLEDGTRVWLNADSHLRFPIAFPGRERRVYLEGEAYFAVAKDAAKPFIVETPQQSLRVLGTEFNIYAYPAETDVYTTLVTGSVMLRSQNVATEIALKPGQQARLSSGSGEYRVTNVDASEVTGWRDGLFVFDNNTLETVFRKLSRWYDFEYVFDDPRARTLEMMGGVPVYDDLAPVLELIGSSGLAEFERKGNQIRIRMKK